MDLTMNKEINTRSLSQKIILVILIIFTHTSIFAAVLLNTVGNSVTSQSTIFRVNVNPTFDFLTGGAASTVSSIVFQMNSTSNGGSGYPGTIASTVQLQILSGSTVLGTFSYSSYDSSTKRVTLSGSAALSANTTYTLKLGCTSCANVGFDQTTTNATGWNFTSNYFNTGYPIVSFNSSSNNAPVLASIGNQSGTVGVAVNLAVSATDSDNDLLTYSASGLPTGLSINTSTGAITGTPTANGAYNTTVTVSDGNGGTDSESFTWTIAAANNAPVLSSIGNQSGTVGVAVSLSVSATDSDNHTLTFSATGLPTGLSINTSTGAVTGTPTTIGVYSTVITVSDGNAGTNSESFTWTITAAPNPIADTRILNLLQSQNAISTRVADESMNPVKNRMNNLLFAPEHSRSNISNQGIRLALKFNPDVSNLISSFGVLDNINMSGDIFKNGWAVWSAGEIIVGEGKRSTEFQINSVTLGADKRFTNKLTLGSSVRLGKEHSDSNVNDTKLESGFYSLSLYGSYALKPDTYIQGALGYSNINIDSERNLNSIVITGDRNANQLFSSVSLSRQFIYQGLQLLSYGAVDGSYTNLDKYYETGSSQTIYFHEQDVKSAALALGLRARYLFQKDFGNIAPRLHLNYQNAFYSESKSTLHYVAQPSSDYVRNSYTSNSHSWLGGFGVDYIYKNIYLTGLYEHTVLVKNGFNDRFMLLGRLNLD